MKHISIIAEQSIIGGVVKTGVSELVDGLAYALTSYYKVSVIIPNSTGSFGIKFTNTFIEEHNEYTYFQICNIHYYILKDEKFFNKMLNLLKPDIIQSIDLNIDYPNVIYGIDEKLPTKNYKKVITFSKWAGEYYNCDYLRSGIVDELVNPENGLFIPISYNDQELERKEYCKKILVRDCALPDITKPIFLYMGRINPAKGEDYFIQAAQIIKDYSGEFICVGPRDITKIYPNIRFMNNWVNQQDTLKYLAGADFYISMSTKETFGLMPRHAARYGTIPILYLTTGLKDDFDASNCISLQLNNLEKGISTAFDLYQNKDKLINMRKTIMNYDFSWQSRIAQWIEFYEHMK